MKASFFLQEGFLSESQNAFRSLQMIENYSQARIFLSKALLILSLAFLLGVALGCFFEFPPPLIQYSSFVLGISFVLVSLIIIFEKRKIFSWCLFGFVGLVLGLFAVKTELSQVGKFPNADFEGKVWISHIPEERADYQSVQADVLEIKKLKIEGENYNRKAKGDESDFFERNQKDLAKKTKKRSKVSPRIMFFADNDPGFEYGEVLEVACRLETPENRYPKFNYQRYLAKKGIYQICRSNRVLKKYENEQRGSLIKHGTFWIRGKLEGQINRLFPAVEGAYLAGLLLGGDDRLPQDVAEDFRRTGTTHIVAVSGYNITVIAGAVMFLAILVGLNRSGAFRFSVVAIFLFVIMIGAPSSATRAAIMGVMILWATKNGRLGDSIRALVFTATLMTAFSPLILVYDVGFQLSFLATAGIILIYGPLSEKFKIENDFLELKSIFLVTLSAQLGVLGLIIYNFETFSPISFLANILILPAIPWIMLIGFMAVIMGFVFLIPAKILALGTWWALNLEVKIIAYLADFSWASVEVKSFNLTWLVMYYGLLIYFVFDWRRQAKESLRQEVNVQMNQNITE